MIAPQSYIFGLIPLFPELHRICTVGLERCKFCYHIRLVLFICDTEPLVGRCQHLICGASVCYLLVDRRLDIVRKQGIVYITNMYNGFRCFYTTKPVAHVGDLSGLRIRGFGNAIGNNLAKYFGFANIGISWGEVFPGIQQKTLDGCEVQVATADGSRLYEVVKNIAMTKHYMLQSAFVCSANFYNSLSPSDRDIFVKTMREAALEYGEIIRNEEAGYYDNMKNHGVTITDVDIAEFQKAIEPLYTNNDLGFSAGLKDRLFKELNE